MSDMFGGPDTVRGQWVPMASWGRRVVASLIDSAVQLLGLLPYVVGLVLLASVLPTGANPTSPTASELNSADPTTLLIASGLMLLGGLLSLGLFLWNRVFQTGRTGQSVGKAAMHIYLVSVTSGQPIGAGSAFIREIAHVVDSILYLGYLWPLWDRRRQTFADKICNCVVAHPSPQRDPQAIYDSLAHSA